MGLRYSGGSSVCVKRLRVQPDRGRSNKCSVSAMRAGMSRVPLALSTQHRILRVSPYARLMWVGRQFGNLRFAAVGCVGFLAWFRTRARAGNFPRGIAI